MSLKSDVRDLASGRPVTAMDVAAITDQYITELKEQVKRLEEKVAHMEIKDMPVYGGY